MIINKSIIISSLALLTSATAFATSSDVADSKEITAFCSAVAQCDKTQDSRAFLHFVTTLHPELATAKGRETLTDIHQLIAERYSGGGMPDFDPGTIAQIKKLLEQLGISGTSYLKLLEYFKKVYPLYIFQIENRVRPEVDTDSKLAVDTVFQAPVDEAYYGLASPDNKYVPEGLSESALEEIKQNGGQGKRNGSYVWGMGTYKDKLFWSTNNNFKSIYK